MQNEKDCFYHYNEFLHIKDFEEKYSEKFSMTHWYSKF